MLDGERMIGSRSIMHRLDEISPEPPLYPAEPEARRAVEEADLWGEETLQALARRMTWWTLRQAPRAITSYGERSSRVDALRPILAGRGAAQATGSRDELMPSAPAPDREQSTRSAREPVGTESVPHCTRVGYPARLEPASALDPLARPSAASASARRVPSGSASSGSSSSSGASTKRRLRHLAVGQRQPLGGELEVAEQEQVDVERARAVAGGVERAAALGLDLLAEVEQRLGLEIGADPDRGVEEVGLVEDLADRLGLVGGGDRLDLDPALAAAPRSRPAGAPRGRRRWSRGPGSRSARGYSSSSSSALSVRSWTTSTATSWIASGSGGSGLAARTRTESQP